MELKTPNFWYRSLSTEPPLHEMALGLLSPLYRLADRCNRNRVKPYKAGIPVICIGNAVAGGSGKTPVALAISALLNDKAPYFLSRGYKGNLPSPALVSLTEHSYAQVGDEPLLLAQTAPTVISKDRALGVSLALEKGAGVVIMDDGLQNHALHKDITFMVIDGMHGFGNLKTLPAGPLREPLHEAFEKTDAFILIGKDNRGTVTMLPSNKPLFNAHVRPIASNLPENKNIIAFAGLGQPQKFYHFLKELGYNVLSWHPFPDHHAYSESTLESLVREAEGKNAALVTTEKDYMRLLQSPYRDNIAHIKIEIAFNDTPALSAFLKERLA